MPNPLMYVFDNLLKYLFSWYKIKIIEKYWSRVENSWYGRSKLKQEGQEPHAHQCNNGQSMCRFMKSNTKTSGQFRIVYLVWIFSPHIRGVTEQDSTKKKEAI